MEVLEEGKKNYRKEIRYRKTSQRFLAGKDLKGFFDTMMHWVL